MILDCFLASRLGLAWLVADDHCFLLWQTDPGLLLGLPDGSGWLVADDPGLLLGLPDWVWRGLWQTHPGLLLVVAD